MGGGEGNGLCQWRPSHDPAVAARPIQGWITSAEMVRRKQKTGFSTDFYFHFSLVPRVKI